jgi:DNA-binding NarL/FixJ family response regulator
MALSGGRSGKGRSAEAQPISAEDLLCLTPNELRLLKQAARGLTDKQIANDTHRSYRTVQTQMQVLRRKLKMRTRFELGFHASNWLTKEQSKNA